MYTASTILRVLGSIRIIQIEISSKNAEGRKQTNIKGDRESPDQ